MKITIVRGRTTDASIYKIADALHSFGYTVDLLLWDRKNNLNVKQLNYHVVKFNFKAAENKFSSVLFFPVWWLFEFIELLKSDADVIHATDLDTLMPAILVKIIKRKKLAYSILDFYANNLPRIRPYPLTDLIRSLVASIEKFGIRFTDVLFLVDERRIEEVRGAKINKINYIYNTPPDIYHNRTRDEPAGRGFTIFFAGGLVKGRGLEYMIKAIQNIDGVKLVIAGPGTDNELAACEAIDANKKIEFIGWLPTYEEVLKYSMKADLLFRFNDPSLPSNRYGSPNKLFEAMMCGIPILINSEFAASSLIEKEDCGVMVPYGDVEAITLAITSLIKDPDRCKKLGANGRKAYEERYSWVIMEKRLKDSYTSLYN